MARTRVLASSQSVRLRRPGKLDLIALANIKVIPSADSKYLVILMITIIS